MATPNITGRMSYGTSGTLTDSAGDTAHPWVIDPNEVAATITGATVAVDDWIIVICTAQTAADSALKIPTAPVAWTVIHPFGTVGGGTMSFGVWAKKRLTGETTYTWTLNNDTGRVNGVRYQMLWAQNAQDIAQWTIGSFVNRQTNATTTTALAPSVTTTQPDTLGLCIATERTIASETDAQVTMSNFTKDWFVVATDITTVTGVKTVSTPAATGDVTVTYPNSHTYNAIAGIVAIPGIVTQPGIAIKRSDGVALQDAWFQLSDGAGGMVDPGDMRVVKPGYSTVTSMLASSPFFVAHRGGSRDFPEMSLYAYGHSVLHGYGALELSLARTSDGVWFGLHDQDINRTSGTTGLAAASSMTWAQIQTYEILGSVASNNPTQPNRPYMKLDELIDIYYPSHVIFMDIKYAAAYQTEFISMISALPGTPTDHIVGKAFGIGSSFPAAMSTAGFQTWGYFYEAQYTSGDLASYQGNWSILGMDYNASAASWTAVTGYGKPVIGHICPTTIARDTALGYGATGLMCSGVLPIVPTTPYSNN